MWEVSIESGMKTSWERGLMWPGSSIDIHRGIRTSLIVLTKGIVGANSWKEKRHSLKRERWSDGITDSTGRVWANSMRCWRTGKPGVLQSVGSQESDRTEQLKEWRWFKTKRTDVSRQKIVNYSVRWSPWIFLHGWRGRSVQGVKQESKSGARS